MTAQSEMQGETCDFSYHSAALCHRAICTKKCTKCIGDWASQYKTLSLCDQLQQLFSTEFLFFSNIASDWIQISSYARYWFSVKQQLKGTSLQHKDVAKATRTYLALYKTSGYLTSDSSSKRRVWVCVHISLKVIGIKTHCICVREIHLSEN